MYNSYKKDSQPWWAMEEAITACRAIEEAKDTTETAFDTIVSDFEDVCNERDEFEEELEQLKVDYEKLEDLTDPKEILSLLETLRTAAAGIVTYVDQSSSRIKEQFNVPQSNSNSTGRTDADGGS
jgi:hypothetical protein